MPDSATLARHCGRFVVAVPVAALAAGFTGALAVSWLPLGAIDAMALAVLTIPLIWGLASYWACADSRLMRPALGLTIAGLASGAALFAG